jgi:signal transduction histidine kinase
LARNRAAAWNRIGNRPRILAALTAVIVLTWLVAILAVPNLRFVVLTPKAKTGFEVSLALLRLFVALVLVLVPEESERDRLRWVAAGFGILGLGGLAFGYLLPLVAGEDLRQAMYGSLLVRSAGIAAMAGGLVPARPPRPTRRTAVLLAIAVIALSVLVVLAPDRLPPLTSVVDLEAAAAGDTATLSGLTAWHWALSAVPLGLAIAAAAGETQRAAGRPHEGWMVVAMVLMAGSQLHTMFWPSAYSPILTTASLLRLAFTIVVAVSAVLTLRRVAVERTALLAVEADLARVRADFAAMVAHELASPVTAIRGYAAVLATGALDREAQIEAAGAIRGEVELLGTLIGDVRAAAAVEREDFAIHPVPVEVAALLAEAAAFARTLPGEHPVDAAVAVQERVVADPERIAQVLRNLLGNAAKHTPPGTPIFLRAERRDGRVRLAVVDRGPGIAPEEVGHVFDKYRRGWTARGDGVPGVGLGLYLSRRIVQAHGGELKVEPTPGGGATFWFELEVAP